MRRSNWLDGLRASLANSPKLRARSPKRRRRIATRRPRFEPLEERTLLATLNVDSPLDNNTPSDGQVTPREAIIAANANTSTDLGQTGSGADTIQFDSAVFAIQRIMQLVFAEMVITESLTINGPGQELFTIDAGQMSRIFDINAKTGDFIIAGLALTNGKTSGDGGAIRSLANLELERISVSSSSAQRGGGIYCDGSLTVTSSLVSNDTRCHNRWRNRLSDRHDHQLGCQWKYNHRDETRTVVEFILVDIHPLRIARSRATAPQAPGAVLEREVVMGACRLFAPRLVATRQWAVVVASRRLMPRT